MRLIDVDELQAIIRVNYNNHQNVSAGAIKIDTIKTAYDVEKVVSELDEYLIKIVGRKAKLYQTVINTVKKRWCRMKFEPKMLKTKEGSFGDRLQKEIVKKCVHRTNFSKKTGICDKSIVAYIRNDRYPNMGTMKLICETLNVSADYLIWGR